jgi:oligo-1,6-glucosidase
MDLDKGENYYKFTWDLLEFKKIMKKWQEGLYEKGWNSLYLNNHDQPRMVSRFGNDGKYRVESAKMLATMIHTQQGTPYIYQGEEIGMTNISFPTIEDYKDIATINLYYKAKEAGFDEDLIMKGIHYHSRDNARTPIQWNSEKNAGFTTGTPWIKVNPNYKEINVENALKDKNSIFYYYRDLIKLRKKHPVIVYGKFEIVNEDDPDIFAYTRTGENEKLFVILNFTDKERKFKPEVEERYDNILISNYERIEPGNGEYSLRPYEARVYIKKI